MQEGSFDLKEGSDCSSQSQAAELSLRAQHQRNALHPYEEQPTSLETRTHGKL